MRSRIMGSWDCEDSEFSAYEAEEEVLNIEHVLGVSGDEFGGPLESSEKPFVRLDGKIKGTPEEYMTKAKIEGILGSSVIYCWDGIEEKLERIVQKKRVDSNQQSLEKYF